MERIGSMVTCRDEARDQEARCSALAHWKGSIHAANFDTWRAFFALALTSMHSLGSRHTRKSAGVVGARLLAVFVRRDCAEAIDFVRTGNLLGAVSAKRHERRWRISLLHTPWCKIGIWICTTLLPASVIAQNTRPPAYFKWEYEFDTAKAAADRAKRTLRFMG